MALPKIAYINGLGITESKSNQEEKTTSKSITNNTELISKEGNTAIVNSSIALLTLNKNRTVLQSGKEYYIDGKYKVVGEVPTHEANAELVSKGYNNMPYRQGESAKIIELTKAVKFVRTYDNENSFKAGSWMMEYDDVKGLSPEEIADKFALPQVPKYICDGTLYEGTQLRTGKCNAIFGYNGGGRQFELIDKSIGVFGNEREIGEKVS